MISLAHELFMSEHYPVTLSNCYLIMKCKEQPPLVGVCIHCMDWTGPLDCTTGLTFELTFELSFFLSMINIAVV